MKKFSRVRGGLSFLLCVTFPGPVALASTLDLIQEVEGLRSTLSPADSSREALTLRLADLYFDHATETFAAGKNADELRRKARSLYQDALDHFSLATAGREKIEFQVSRLMSDQGQNAEAERLWRKLSESAKSNEIKREASLRLAESLDDAGKPAQSEPLFRTARSLCDTPEICGYVQYRLSWVLKRKGQLNDALAAIDQALWDSRGQPREEALRDLVAWLGETGDDGISGLRKIEPIAAKLSRPQLIEQLGDSYFVAGNKPAGVMVLSYVQGKSPSFVRGVKLLEETYGLRQFDAFKSLLDQVSKLSPSSEDKDSEKVLKRLALQLDGERKTRTEYQEPFQRVVEFTLSRFPNTSERQRLVEGWMASEEKLDRRITQAQAWLTQAGMNWTPAEQLKLRRIRAAALQKSTDHVGLSLEMDRIAGVETTEAARREARYVSAKALFDAGRADEALARFRELSADPVHLHDNWAIQSQHLSLEILNRKRDYSGIQAEVARWAPVSATAVGREIAEFRKIGDQAQFEAAVSLGVNPQALATFRDYCKRGLFAEKSCENARLLSAKLNDREALYATLEVQAKWDELEGELERGGEFARAADLRLSRLSTHGITVQQTLKNAVLFELSGNAAKAAEAYAALPRAKDFSGTFAKSQDSLYALLEKTGQLGAMQWTWNWNSENRDRLALRLVESPSDQLKGDLRAKVVSYIEKSSRPLGAHWARAQYAPLIRLDEAQAKIDFYGRNGQRKFENRLAALKAFVKASDQALQRADSELRVAIADRLERSHRQLAEQIEKSPLPEGLNEEARAEVQAAIQKMALPFTEKATAYLQMKNEQLLKIADPVARENATGLSRGTAAISGDQIAGLYPTRPASPAASASVLGWSESERGSLQGAIAKMRANPGAVEALSEFKRWLQERGRGHLVAYLEGRIRGETGK